MRVAKSKDLSKSIPYDYSCPSTKDALMKQICKHCGLHFGSFKQKLNHNSCCKSYKSAISIDDQQEPMNRVRPQRIAAHQLKKITLHYGIY